MDETKRGENRPGVDNDLPGGGRPDAGRPGRPGERPGVDNDLPGRQTGDRPDNELPGDGGADGEAPEPKED